MIDVIIFLLSVGGFLLLLVAQTRHQRLWFGHKLGNLQQLLVRCAGFCALIFALVAAILGLGWSYGLLTWLGWLSVAAFVVVFLNLRRERRGAKP